MQTASIRIIRTCLLIAFTSAAAVAQPNRESTDPVPLEGIPASPAGRAYAATLEVLGTGDWDALKTYLEKNYSPTLGRKIEAETLAKNLRASHLRAGGYEHVGLAPDERITPELLVGLVRNQRTKKLEKFYVRVQEGEARKIVLCGFKSTHIGSSAPDWELETPDGQIVRLKDLRGKVVVVDFWAAWCQPCLSTMPWWQQMHEKHNQAGLQVVGVHIWEDEVLGDRQAMVQLQNSLFHYTMVEGTSTMTNAYHVKSLPTFLIIDRDGAVAYEGAGQLNLESDRIRVANVLASLLEPSPHPMTHP